MRLLCWKAGAPAASRRRTSRRRAAGGGRRSSIAVSTYGSKDQLIRAYLQKRSENWQALVAEALPATWDNPRDRILGLFELLIESSATPGYNGCPFINASAEAAANDAVSEVRDQHRARVRELFTNLGR